MLVAAKHQHPKPAQSRAHPSTAHSFLQMHLSSQGAKSSGSAVLHPGKVACDGLPGSGASTATFPMLWHPAPGQSVE